MHPGLSGSRSRTDLGKENVYKDKVSKLDIASRRSVSPDGTWSALRAKISPKRPKMTSVRYFGGLWMTFNEELQGKISACLQRTYICIIYHPQDDLTFCIRELDQNVKKWPKSDL